MSDAAASRILQSGVQAVAFAYELEDSISLIHDGLRSWRDHRQKWFASASISFCTGIEKLMKLVLVLDSFEKNEELTNTKIAKEWGHKLDVLFEEISRRQLWVDGAALIPYGGTLETVRTDEDLKALCEVLRYCSGWSRYANLDALMKPKETLDTPKRDFDRLIMDWAFEADPEWSNHGEEAVEDAWRRVFTALQRWVRALCRIFIFGRISPEGKRWIGEFRDFHLIRDSELSSVRD